MEPQTQNNSFFGDGTFEKPKLKFYFTKPCPSLGIETGSSLADFGRVPGFQFVDNQLACDLCDLKFLSGLEAIKHWQQETLQLGCKYEKIDIPSFEVKPGVGIDIGSLSSLVQKNEADVESNTSNNVEKYLDETLDEEEHKDLFEKEVQSEDINNQNEENDEEAQNNEPTSDDLDPNNYDFSNSDEDENMGKNDEEKDEYMGGEDEENDIEQYLDIKMENESSGDDCSINETNEELVKMETSDRDINQSEDIKDPDFKPETVVKPKKDGKGKVFKCAYENCVYDTLHGSLLRRHIKHVHQLIRYDCTYCDLKGIGRDGLRKHIKRKHKENSFLLKEHIISDVVVSETKNFLCEFENCDFKATNPWLLKRHKRNVHEGVKYDCTVCDSTGLGYEGIRKHMKSKHEGVPCELAHLKISTADLVEKPKDYFKEGDDYVCKICDHRAKILDSLRMHIKRKHEDKMCTSCEFKAKDIETLREHANSEHGGVLYRCKHCEKNLVSLEGLKRHELHYHSEVNSEGAEMLFCDQCAYSAFGKYQLKRHIQSVHAGKGTFKCDICDYVANKKQQLVRHIKSKHEGVKFKVSLSSQCDMCEYRCTGPAKLATHMGAKHGVGGATFFCDQCDFTSQYITSVQNHRKWKHDNITFKCDYCEFTTKFKQFLQNHIDNKHLGIKHNCDECDYAGASAQCLTSHKNSQHLGIKYPCDQCDYKASQPGSLSLHKKAKHSNVRFYCEFCDYTASFQGNLRAHLKKSHNINYGENAVNIPAPTF